MGRSSTIEFTNCLTNKDKEETAQWLASPGTCKSILEACLSRVSSLKGQTILVHHLTMYDGTWEKVVCEMMHELADVCHMASYSETDSPAIFQFAVGGVKDKLLEDEWGGEGGETNPLSTVQCSKHTLTHTYDNSLLISDFGIPC